MSLGLSFGFYINSSVGLEEHDLKPESVFLDPHLSSSFWFFSVCKKIQATLNTKSSLIGIVEPELKHMFEIGT
jgi:hypothetical protein